VRCVNDEGDMWPGVFTTFSDLMGMSWYWAQAGIAYQMTWIQVGMGTT